MGTSVKTGQFLWSDRKFFKEIEHDYRFEVVLVSKGKTQKKKGKAKKKKWKDKRSNINTPIFQYFIPAITILAVISMAVGGKIFKATSVNIK